jgi:hypothetical protein
MPGDGLWRKRGWPAGRPLCAHTVALATRAALALEAQGGGFVFASNAAMLGPLTGAASGSSAFGRLGGGPAGIAGIRLSKILFGPAMVAAPRPSLRSGL